MKNSHDADASSSGASKSKSKKPKVVDMTDAVLEATENLMPADKAPKAYPPPTPGPLSVYTPSGRLVHSNAPTVIQCLAELSRKVKEVTTITVPLNRGDCDEFQRHYDNRDTSDANVAKLTRRFNTQDYLRDYPSLAFDAEAKPFNGGHTTKAFCLSKIESFPFVVTLGIDPKMGTREDTNKTRDLIDQCYYLGAIYGDQINVYKGLDKKDQRTYTASSAYIFSMIVASGLLEPPIELQPGEAKREVVQHPRGQLLLRQCFQPFLDNCKLLANLDAADVKDGDESSTYKSFQRVAFLVPAMIFRMAGYKDYAKQIMKPLTTSGPLYRAHEYLWRRSDEDTVGTEMTIRREQVEILHVISTLLAYAYCAANPEAKLRLPKPRWEKIKVLKEGKRKNDQKIIKAIKKADGDRAYIWSTYTRKEQTEDAEIRREIATFFLSKIKLEELEA